jgi:dimeric dUTPase (all-alpha-NTP-PPase superfamily)
MEQSTLQLILDKQKEFQTRFGFSEDMDLKDRMALIHTHSMFLIEETFEMLRELPYHKYWKDYSNLTEEEVTAMLTKAREEWIDKLHFLINIGVFLNFTEDQIREMYLEKNGLNIRRQVDPALGYVAE